MQISVSKKKGRLEFNVAFYMNFKHLVNYGGIFVLVMGWILIWIAWKMCYCIKSFSYKQRISALLTMSAFQRYSTISSYSIELLIASHFLLQLKQIHLILMLKSGIHPPAFLHLLECQIANLCMFGLRIGTEWDF